MVGCVRMLPLGIAVALLLAAPAAASRMPAPPHVTVHEDTPCPGDRHFRSCADYDTVYLAPGADRHERLHEIGHLFDSQVLTNLDRAWFTRVLGYPASTEWFPPYSGTYSRENHRRQPGEGFAETYADCALGWVPAHRVARARGGKEEMRVVDVTEASGRSHFLSLTVHQYRRVCVAISVLGYLHDYQSSEPSQDVR